MPRKAAQPLPALPHAAGQDPQVKTAFANNLRRKMQEKGLTQAELARRARLTRDNVHGYVNGAVFPRPDKMQALARALDCPTEELLPLSAMPMPLAEEPALDMHLSGKPGMVWLRVAVELPLEDAMRIMRIVQGSKGEADRQSSSA